MIFNLEQIKPAERVEPPLEELEKIFEYYKSKLKTHSYQVRDPESYCKLAEYFALFYMSVRHNYPQNIHGPNDLIYSKPKYGMLIFGPNGSGKTMALSIFSGLFHINFIHADELIAEYAKGGEQAFWEYADRFNNADLIFDDLGSERNLKSFGNSSPIIDFIIRRERQYKDLGVLTHFSTNLKTNKDLTDIYGDRCKSRIVGMTQEILINAKDKRKEKDKILQLSEV